MREQRIPPEQRSGRSQVNPPEEQAGRRGINPLTNVRGLQRAIGNRAVVDLLSVGQAKLDVGAAHDPLEEEADALARDVVAALQSDRAPMEGDAHSDDLPAVRRRARFGADGGTLDAATEASVDNASGRGSPLKPAVRRQFEDAFGGEDFSGVRLHAGSDAAELNDRLSAHAFTVGNDVFFREGIPDLDRPDGQDLMAHELTHTIQQSSQAGRRVRRKKKEPVAPPPNVDVVDSWLTYSSIKGKPRSKELKAIDKAVAAWKSGAKSTPGNIEANTSQLEAIVKAIGEWRLSKTDTSLRELMVQALSEKVNLARSTFESKRLEKIKQGERNEEWKKYGGTAGQYAVRSNPNAPDNLWGGLTERGEDGLVTDEALEKMKIAHGENMMEMVKGNTEASGLGEGVDTEDAVKGLMAGGYKDTFAGDSSEEKQLRSGTEKGVMVTETRDLAGFTVKVTKDDTDTLGAEARLTALEQALLLIGTRITERPSFHVWLPKFGMRITPGAKPQEVEVHKDLARAEFYFPDLLLLTPMAMDSTVGNSISAEVYEQAQKDNKYADERGIASCVHELGHLLHFKLNPKMFVDVNQSTLKGDIKKAAVEGVSSYASGNPKELVAEMFAGMIYGRKYSDQLTDAYAALGGPKLS